MSPEPSLLGGCTNACHLPRDTTMLDGRLLGAVLVPLQATSCREWGKGLAPQQGLPSLFILGALGSLGVRRFVGDALGCLVYQVRRGSQRALFSEFFPDAWGFSSLRFQGRFEACFSTRKGERIYLLWGRGGAQVPLTTGKQIWIVGDACGWSGPVQQLAVNKTEIRSELQAVVWRHLGLSQLTLPKRLRGGSWLEWATPPYKACFLFRKNFKLVL